MANLRIPKLLLLLQKRCLNTLPPPPSLSKPSSSCGLPLTSAGSVSQKLHSQEHNDKKLHSVIDYLKNEGFTQTHIAKFIQIIPTLLHSNVETTLRPKLEFLKQKGFVGELLTEILVKTPNILNRSLASQIRPSFELLRSYLGSDDEVVVVMTRCSRLFGSSVKNVMQPNIELLVKEGVPSTSIAKIISLKPRAIEQKHSRIIYAVNAVKKLGLQPTSPMFVHAFKVVVSLSESTWKKKMEFLQSFGWSEEDILTAFKRFPNIMAFSEGRIRKSIDFYQNTMQLDMQTIITHTELLGYAVDTRVRPRDIILKILESKKLIKENRMTFSWITISNKKFFDKYVIKYVDIIPGLLETYNISQKAEKIST